FQSDASHDIGWRRAKRQGEEDENTSFRLSFPVPPMLIEQTSQDSCDGYWLGRGEGANFVNAR
ncbi:putative outer membrane usher protein ElfC, partial [Dissostichus eleginoides]